MEQKIKDRNGLNFVKKKEKKEPKRKRPSISKSVKKSVWIFLQRFLIAIFGEVRRFWFMPMPV